MMIGTERMHAGEVVTNDREQVSAIEGGGWVAGSDAHLICFRFTNNKKQGLLLHRQNTGGSGGVRARLYLQRFVFASLLHVNHYYSRNCDTPHLILI